MDVQIEIVDTHIVYNTIDNKPYKIIITKDPYIQDNIRLFNMFIRYDEFLWVSIISEEELKKIQKSDDITLDDITLDEPYVNMFGCVRMNVYIKDFGRLIICKITNNVDDIYNQMLARLDLFEIDEQQYVLK